MTSITIECPGKPADIRAGGEWLRHQIETAVHNADLNAGTMWSNSLAYWEGESGQAFNSVAGDLVEVTRELGDVAGSIAEKFHVYAGEIERVQNRYAGYLEHAVSSGLLVDGVRVYRPEWVGSVPQGSSDPDWDEWRDLRKKQRDYDRIEEDVLSRKAELVGWVAENLLPIITELSGPTLASQLYDKLTTVVGLGNEIGGEYLDNHLSNSIDELGSNAETWSTRAAEIERRSVASGSPATRARLQELIQQHIPEHLRSAARGASSFTEVASVLRSVAKHMGTGADIALALWEISDGAEPVDVGIEILGGIGGGAVAVALGSNPVGWGVIVIAGAGIAGGALASGIWGATPESWREGIYHWVDDGIVIGGDVVEEVGDWFYDTSEAIGGWFR